LPARPGDARDRDADAAGLMILSCGEVNQEPRRSSQSSAKYDLICSYRATHFLMIPRR
jgi:hypothetical protein